MARKPIYLDYNATTPVHPEVVKIMNQYYLDDFGLNAHMLWIIPETQLLILLVQNQLK